jgi:hypothetical protein
MADAGRGFADIAEESSPNVRAWQQGRQEAILFLRSLGEGRVFQVVAEKLNKALVENGELPPNDRLSALVHDSASILGLSEYGIEMLQGRQVEMVEMIAISGALAVVLGNSEPNQERLSKVADVESFLDIPFVAECLSRSEASETWRSFLRKAQLSVESINDDEYQAKDELERWRKELGRPVPSWRSRDFPHMGIATGRLLSGLLRVLDEEAWLSFLDRLPVPAMMEALLWDTHVEREPERLLDWLRRAPLAFDRNGKRTTGALVFVLERRALSLIEDDLMRRCSWGNEEDARRQALSEGKVARQDLVAAIKCREDGDDLLAELSARCMLMAQSSEPDSPRTKLRYDFYFEVGLEYAKALGDPKEVLERMRRREAVDRSRSRWGLWLAASSRVVSLEAESVTAEQSEVLRSCWMWMEELLVDKDAGIAGRYGAPVQWTERFAGIALASSADPHRSLEEAWKALTAQRLAPQEDRYSRDAWATSRFLIRAAYFAYHGEENDEKAIEIWSAGMTMALSAWLTSPNADPFAEVAHGLAHLAKGQRVVDDEPRRTFEYLVGLPQEVSRGIILLLDNGMSPQRVISAAAKAGIDARNYLALNRDERMKESIQRATAKLGFAAFRTEPGSDPAE